MAISESIARRGLDSPWESLIAYETAGDLDLYLLTKAIISVESAWRADAINPRDPSYGLMQVVPYDRGGAGPVGVSGDALLDPATSIAAGVGFLRDLGRRWSGDDVIAAYNAGSPRRAASGLYVNQGYVDKVREYLDWYREHLPVVETGDPDPGEPWEEGPTLASTFGLPPGTDGGIGLLAVAGLALALVLLGRR